MVKSILLYNSVNVGKQFVTDMRMSIFYTWGESYVLQNHSTRKGRAFSEEPRKVQGLGFFMSEVFRLTAMPVKTLWEPLQKWRKHFQGDCLAISRGKLRSQLRFARSCRVNGYLGHRDQRPSLRLSGSAPPWFATVSVCISWNISL